MARIINTKDYIQENIKIRQALEQNNVNTRLTEGTATYTNYFRQQELESMYSNLGADSYLGPSSPLRFSEIEDFPLFINQASSLDISQEDHGLEADMNIEGGVLQGTIVPLINDFVFIQYLSEEYLFRVSNVTTDTLRAPNTHFYRINLELYRTHSKDEIRRQVTETLVALEENIGTEKRVLVTKKESILLSQIINQYDYLKNMYIDFFYRRKFSSFVCKEMFMKNVGVEYVCFHSEYFIHRHNLMYEKTDTNSIIIAMDSNEQMEYYPEYAYSIYGSIENKDISLLTYRVFHEKLIENPLSVLGGYQYGFHNLTPSNHAWSKDIYFNDNLLERIKFNNLYPDTENKPLENLIIKYYNNSINEVYDFKKHILSKNLNTYILTPLALFILSFIRQNILIKTTKGGNKLCSQP